MSDDASNWQPDLEELRSIHAACAETVKETPVFSLGELSRRCGGTVVVKAENMQRTGSFKLRGSLAKLAGRHPGNCRGVVAGSAGMPGAAHLVAAGAQRAGAGMVHLSSPGTDGTPPIEAVTRRIPVSGWDDPVLADLHRFHSLVIGPGLGRDEPTVPAVVRVVLDAVVPVVVDGDVATVMGNDDGQGGRTGRAYFLKPTMAPTLVQARKPLTFRSLQIEKRVAGGRYNLATWPTEAPYFVSVEAGVLMPSPY